MARLAIFPCKIFVLIFFIQDALKKEQKLPQNILSNSQTASGHTCKAKKTMYNDPFVPQIFLKRHLS